MMNEKGRNPVLPPEICIADGEAHDAEPQENGVCQTDLQKKFKGRFDTIHIFGSVVVADDRL